MSRAPSVHLGTLLLQDPLDSRHVHSPQAVRDEPVLLQLMTAPQRLDHVDQFLQLCYEGMQMLLAASGLFLVSLHNSSTVGTVHYNVAEQHSTAGTARHSIVWHSRAGTEQNSA